MVEYFKKEVRAIYSMHFLNTLTQNKRYTMCDSFAKLKNEIVQQYDAILLKIIDQ